MQEDRTGIAVLPAFDDVVVGHENFLQRAVAIGHGEFGLGSRDLSLALIEDEARQGFSAGQAPDPELDRLGTLEVARRIGQGP